MIADATDFQENGIPDWGQGLPIELLAKIAGGRDLLKAMRGVSHSWQAGFEASVVGITIGHLGPGLLGYWNTQRRFSGVTHLDLGCACMDNADLANVRFFHRLTSLSIRKWFLELPLDVRSTQLFHNLTDAGFSQLAGLPISRLYLSGCDLVTGAGLRYLRELKDLYMYNCNGISDAGLKAIVGLPLTEVWLSNCKGISNRGLRFLAGMPLTDLNLGSGLNLTDAGLECLRGLPLTKLVLKSQFTDNGLENIQGLPLEDLSLESCQNTGLGFLKGLPLTSLSLHDCCKLSNAGLNQLSGLPLQYLTLMSCPMISDEGLQGLNRTPLTSLNIYSCELLEGSGLGYLRELPLSSLTLQNCKSLGGLQIFQGLPLKVLHLYFCSELTSTGLKVIKSLPLLEDLCLERASQVTDDVLACLRGLPLSSLNLSKCDQVSNAGVASLRGMRLTDLDLEGCSRVGNPGLAHLQGMPLSSLKIQGCACLTDSEMEYLRGMPLKVLTLGREKYWRDNYRRSCFSECLFECFPMFRRNKPCNITDRGLACLQNMQLRRLSLGHCPQLTDAGFVSSLSGMPLEFLDVSDCDGLTNASLDHFSAMPDLHLSVYPSRSGVVWDQTSN